MLATHDEILQYFECVLDDFREFKEEREMLEAIQFDLDDLVFSLVQLLQSLLRSFKLK